MGAETIAGWECPYFEESGYLVVDRAARTFTYPFTEEGLEAAIYLARAEKTVVYCTKYIKEIKTVWPQNI